MFYLVVKYDIFYLQNNSCCEITSHRDKFVYDTVVRRCSAEGCQHTTSTLLWRWENVHSGLHKGSSKPVSGICHSLTYNKKIIVIYNIINYII